MPVYGFKKDYKDGRTGYLMGGDQVAASPEAAMAKLKLLLGYSAEQGWRAVEVEAGATWKEVVRVEGVDA